MSNVVLLFDDIDVENETDFPKRVLHDQWRKIETTDHPHYSHGYVSVRGQFVNGANTVLAYLNQAANMHELVKRLQIVSGELSEFKENHSC